MKRSYFLIVLALLAVPPRADAMCKDGTIGRCTIGGKPGTRECVNGRWTPCEPNEPTTPPENGTVRPKYYVLTVVYAPPGTQGGGSTSKVAYGSGSTTGTTTSSTHSFKQGYSVSVTTGLLIKELGASFGYARTSSRNDAVDIKKSAANTITATGPAADGIHHERDLIYLWLNPAIDLSLTPTSAAWTLKSGVTADIQYVHVGWLQDPSQMPPGVTQRLQTYGITTQDYQEILKADAFASGPSTIDPARFQALNTTFPYEPPFAQGDPVPTYQFTVTNSNTTSSASSVQREYTVGLTATGGGSFLSLLKAQVKAASSWTWTNATTTGTSSGTSESASVTVGGPAFGYAGPTDMAVYYDVLNKTFLFAPLEGAVFSVRGSVRSGSGKNVRGKEVVLVANGVRYRTFTNARGQYRFPGRVSGAVRLQVGTVKKQLPTVRPSQDVEILVP